MKWLIALSLLALGATLGAQELVLGAEDAAGPWGQADGTGCGNEIVKAAFAAADVQVRFKILPYARAKEQVLAGSLAGCFAMSAAPELKGKVVFSREPLYTVATTFFRQEGRHPEVHALAQVPQGSVVGTVIGYEYPAPVQALAARGIRLASNTSETANLEMLAAGRLAFAVLQLDELKSLDLQLKVARVHGKVIPAFTLKKEGSFVGFSVNHPQGRWAKGRFDQGFARIKANGTLAAILEAWKVRLK